MRRDQILRQQEPILAGNLPPADLPNPHEPVRSEETTDGHSGSWSASSYVINDDDDEEERNITSPLRNDKSVILQFNGHNTSKTTGHTQEALMLGTLQDTQRTPLLSRWLARILGPFLK